MTVDDPLLRSVLGHDVRRSVSCPTDDGIPYLIDEFWTAGQRSAHRLHEISYRACFKAQLPDFFISRATEPGDSVHDPFMGRGTTPLQAALTGRRPMGNDVNPLSAMLLRPRLDPPSIQEVADRLAIVPWDDDPGGDDGLRAFFHHRTLSGIRALRLWLAGRDAVSPLDPVDDWIRMVAMNRLTGHSPGFLSGYTLPPNQAASLRSQERMNAKSGRTPPERDIVSVLLRKTRSLLSHGSVPTHPPTLLCVGSASSTPAIATASVDLVVTSPPFLTEVHYASDNWLRAWFACIDMSSVGVSMHGGVPEWEAMARSSLAEIARVVRPGGYVAYEVGEVRKGRVRLERSVWSAAADLPFERLAVMVHDQKFTKTSNIWGVGNNVDGTNTNRIVLLRRS